MSLLNDTRTLVYSFIALRVVLLLVYWPEVVAPANLERGLTTLGDFREHYDFARAIDADHLPYRDYWVEFPPIWIGLTGVLAQLTRHFTAWASLLYLVMLACDLGNLLLLRRLGAWLHGPEIGLGLAWVYAVMGAPLVMLAWNFEVLVTFSLLAALYGYWVGLEAGRGRWLVYSAGALALGILAKYIPLLMVPMVWKFAPRRLALLYSLGVAVVVAGVLVPLMVWGGPMAVQSLTIQFDKPPYQTVWALLEGEYGTGSFPGGAVRQDAAWEWPASPSAWLQWRSIPFAIVGLWLFLRPSPTSPTHQLAFVSLTISLFMLWSQGWSPQWAVLLIPLLLLNFPNRTGLLACLVLTLGAFLEYPALFRHSADTGNLIPPELRPWFAALVLLRTGLLMGVSAILAQRLVRPG